MAAALALASLTTSCAPQITIRAEGSEYELASGEQSRRLMDDLRSTVRGAEVELHVSGELPAQWRPVVSFVHLSDVQIRDHEIVLQGKNLEPVSDFVAGGAVRAESLDRNDEFPLLALIEGLNRRLTTGCSDPRDGGSACPAFLVHTGDAIDAGSMGELMQFLNVMNRSQLPWFNVVGNHDVFIFGNFSQRRLSTKALLGFASVNSRERFVEAHGEAGTRRFAGGIDPHFTQHLVTEYGNGVTPASGYHGFDLRGGSSAPTPRSYYSVVLGRTSPTLRLIVLDTVAQDTDTEMRTVGGFFGFFGLQVPGKGAWAKRLDEEQSGWLIGELEKARREDQYALVFGHHPLSEGSRQLTYAAGHLAGTPPLRDLLLSERRVLGYFSGHTHVPSLTQARRSDDSLLAEVTAASYHEYPQLAFLVTVLRLDGELGVAVRPLQATARGGGLEARVRKACEGARQEADETQLRFATDETCTLTAAAEMTRFYAPVARGIEAPPLDDSGRPELWHPDLLDCRLRLDPGAWKLGGVLASLKHVLPPGAPSVVVDSSIGDTERALPLDLVEADLDQPLGPFLARVLERASAGLTGPELEMRFDSTSRTVTVYRRAST